MASEQYESLQQIFNIPAEQLNKKIKHKREIFLNKHQLFRIIYQKKGGKNFEEIVDNIKLYQFPFGFNIIQNQAERSFNYLVRGTAMIFVCKSQEENGVPVLYKKVGPGEYFGEKEMYNGMKLHSVKSVGKTYVLQLPLQNFYKAFSGHFKYPELKQKVDYLQKIWIFHGIGRHERQRILLMSKNLTLKKNGILFREGDEVDYFYIVTEGQLTLFHTKSNKQTNHQNKKHSPFMILTNCQVCGIQQLYRGQNFEYMGMSTTAVTKLLCFSKKLFEDSLRDRIPNQNFLSINSQIKKQFMNIQQGQLMLKQLQEIKSDLGIPRLLQKELQQLQQFKTKSRISKFHARKRSVKSVQKLYTQPQQPITTTITKTQQTFNIHDYPISKQNTLKNKNIRELILAKKKQQQKASHSSMRISSYTNNCFTMDKQILLGYLVRKEKQEKLAEKNQLNFRNTQFNLVKELSVEKSVAIRNQKRKLKKSRRNAVSVPNLL